MEENLCERFVGMDSSGGVYSIGKMRAGKSCRSGPGERKIIQALGQGFKTDIGMHSDRGNTLSRFRPSSVDPTRRWREGEGNPGEVLQMELISVMQRGFTPPLRQTTVSKCR